MVTIRVYFGAKGNGEVNPTIFNVHKEVICFYSPYFDSVFNGPFIENEMQSIAVYKINSERFGMFIHWLYRQNLDFEEETYTRHNNLAELWLLARRFNISKLQNDVIGKIVGFSECPLWIGFALKIAYEDANGCKLLREALVACAVVMDLAQTLVEAVPVQALKDIIDALQKQNVKLKAGEAIPPLRASDYYVPVPE